MKFYTYVIKFWYLVVLVTNQSKYGILRVEIAQILQDQDGKV